MPLVRIAGEAPKSTALQLVKKAITRNSEWNDPDDLMEVLNWLRHASSIIIGIIFGLCGFTGWTAFPAYYFLLNLSVLLYLHTQNVHPDELGGLMMINMDGFNETSVAFVVAWIAAHTVQLS